MDAVATPIRFWWLKRIVVGFILFEAIALGLRSVAVAVAQKRLSREIDAIHARGDPILPQDFADRPVAENQNAAPDLALAGKSFKLPKGQEVAWDSLLKSTPYTAGDLQLIEEVFSQNREVFAAVRRARQKPAANWGLEFRSPTFTILLPMLNDCKELANDLEVFSRRAIQRGEDAEAVEYWRDMLVISRALDAQPFIVSQLVAYSVNNIASNTVYELAPKLQIKNGDGKSASEAQLRALIGELLEERDKERSGWRWAFLGERMFQVDLMLCLAGGQPLPKGVFGAQNPEPAMTWWIRPMLFDDARELLKQSTTYIEAALAPDATSANAKLTRPKTRNSSPRHWWDMTLFNPNMSRLVLRKYQGILLRRQAAAALAARMFEIKYGRRPANVRELVPEFLESAPLDPVVGGGAVIFIGSPATQPATRPNRY